MNKQNTEKQVPVKSIRLGIADDSAVIREGLVQKAQNLSGVEIVWEADTVAQTIAAFRLMSSDVIILDIEMPDGSGIDVLETIKKESPDTIVMMFTNYSLMPFRKRCLRAGADHFFDKSTEFGKLFDTLKDLTQHHPNQGN